MTDAHRRALVVAYFLSRFDRKGVRELGYASFSDAFDKVGHALGVPSATVKHMRDSFDPYCSQVRVGWYQRPILRSRANVIQAYDEVGVAGMAEIVRGILAGDSHTVRLAIAPIADITAASDTLLDDDNPFSSRLRTGDLAEEFFLTSFPSLGLFMGSSLEDTRRLGIGYDFRASHIGGYRAVEVKGLLGDHGAILFTDREWSVARILEHSYVLAVVRSLATEPSLELYQNPVASLAVTMRVVESVSICWNTRI